MKRIVNEGGFICQVIIFIMSHMYCIYVVELVHANFKQR